MHRLSGFALVAMLAGGAIAQEAPRRDAGDARATAAAVLYRSAFEGYRPYAEQESTPWRAANDEAARLGGHMGHVRVPPAPGKPPGAPAKDQGHGRHR